TPSEVLTSVSGIPIVSVTVGWPVSSEPPAIPISTLLPSRAMETSSKSGVSFGNRSLADSVSQAPFVAIPTLVGASGSGAVTVGAGGSGWTGRVGVGAVVAGGVATGAGVVLVSPVLSETCWTKGSFALKSWNETS